MSEASSAQKDQLMADLRLVLADAEALLAATAGDASSSVAELRERVQATLLQPALDVCKRPLPGLRAGFQHIGNATPAHQRVAAEAMEVLGVHGECGGVRDDRQVTATYGT